MSQSALKFQTEHEMIEKNTSLQSYFVRQDRLPLREGEAFFVTDQGISCPVWDISPFGMALSWNHPVTFDQTKPLTGELFIGDFRVDTLQLTPVRQFTGSQGERIEAFEIEGKTLDPWVIFGVRDLNTILREHESFFSEPHLNAEFKNLTLELYFWLEGLEKRINELEKQQHLSSPQDWGRYESAVTEKLAQYIAQKVTPLYPLLEGICAPMSNQDKKKHFAFFRRVLGEFFFQSYYAHRAFQKPKGYAGDFEMMRTVYHRERRGMSLFAKSMESYFVNVPEAEAVRNRGHYLKFKIHQSLLPVSTGPVKILSLACGPAQELDYLAKEYPEDFKKTHFYLVDQDEDALRLAQRQLRSHFKSWGWSHPKEQPVTYWNYAVKNIIETGLPENDYHLIYTAGLFDYLTDPVAQACAKQLWRSLKPGGQLIIGNFDSSAPNRFGMALITDWHLIYRTEEDLTRLFDFLGPVTVEKEPLGINLFAVITKSS
jgi:extracellular factor (EF) 3-hydroxypalmitic acid methyl ester biosynthesis protein